MILRLDLDDIGHGFLADILAGCVTIFESGQRGIALIFYISCRTLIEIVGCRLVILIKTGRLISIETQLVVRNHHSLSIIDH